MENIYVIHIFREIPYYSSSLKIHIKYYLVVLIEIYGSTIAANIFLY